MIGMAKGPMFFRPLDCFCVAQLSWRAHVRVVSQCLGGVTEYDQSSMVSTLSMWREDCKHHRFTILEAEDESMRLAREFGESGSSDWNNG